MKKKAFVITAALLVLMIFPAVGQVRQSYLDRPSQVILPQDYDSSKTYPLLLSLPWTTGTGEEFYRYYRQSLQTKDFILVFPPGRPTRNHYLPDFISFVKWFEARAIGDVKAAMAKYSVNPEAVYLGGYSLGGDLSWAFLNRNPDIFKGAMIFGTRCSYAHKAENLALMRERGVKVFFGIGNREHTTRSAGINRAYQALRNAGLDVKLQEYPGAHTNPPRAMAGTALAHLGVPNPSRSTVVVDPVPVEEPLQEPEEVEPTPKPEDYDDWFQDSDDWFSSAPAPNIPENWDDWDDDWFNSGDDFFN
jgi:dienelactone hydrolase